MISIDELLQEASYLPEAGRKKLKEAYEYAETLYEDFPYRLSGDPYISHPIAVCHILAQMRLDHHTLISGILHKALRGTPAKSTPKKLKELFGGEVATIVSGTTKIEDIQFKSRLDYKAENVKKMLLAITQDIRVLLVKLADHLHDMRTLSYVKPERQKELARDTMDLYAPLASRLGIDWIKRELEDLGFEYIYPEKHAELTSKIEMSLQDREKFVDEIKSILAKSLQENGIKKFTILGRPKHLYSIYRKLISQNIPIEKVYDKVAFRVILKTIPECYEVMGIVHTLWKPIPHRFKDFISTPKSNMYQSLHTSVIGPHGDFMEIQIRTEKMDEIANDGIAAHWAYKEKKVGVSSKDVRLFQWLKQLVQSLQDVDDSKEFLDAVRDELDHTEVYALTPNGDVKELPAGSTPLDFAYMIHTEVGNHCTGAKIDGRIVPLKHEIQNGDVIEIITSPNQQPNSGWLNLVKTTRARNRIKQWLNKEEQEKFLKEGREICERELRKHDLNLKKLIKTGHFSQILKTFSCNSLDELMRRVGSGKITTKAIIYELQPPEIKEEKELKEAESAQLKTIDQIGKKSTRKSGKSSPFVIDGIDGMMVRVSNCCMPMPGDKIMGFITAGRGVSIHKANCQNLLATDKSRWIDAKWNETAQIEHKARVQVLAMDRKGLLVSVCNIVNADDADILDVEAHKLRKLGQAKIDLTLAVSNRDQLGSLLQSLREMDGVLEAKRL